MNQEAIISDTISFGERTVEVRKEHLKIVLSNLKEQFEVLMDCTGVDYILPEKRTKVMYWLHNPTTYARIRIIVYVPRDGSLPSVTDLWEGADWYERELFDLFGVQFEGHPDLKRILLPDDWVGHPLRRDYSLHDVAVEFKHGIQPKKPAEIIPDVRK